MALDLVVLLVSFAVILLGAALFTNGIEWFGRKLELAEGAVGSVLAAVGTALPETLIPIIAIGFGGKGIETDEIGVGAILGAPFMLATLAMFVTGATVLYRGHRRRRDDTLSVDTGVLGTDVRYFAAAYALALAVALLPPEATPARWAGALILLAIYANYVRRHFEADPDVDASDLAPLRLGRLDRGRGRVAGEHPRMRVVGVQVVVALGGIIAGAVVFVGAVDRLSLALGVPPVLLALVIAPVATELPEKTNSVIWVLQGKDTLAMGNITGAMVFQSCIPVVVGIVLAPASWHLSGDSALAFASAAIAFASTAAIFWPMVSRGQLTGRRLVTGGLFYVAYVGLILATLAGIV